MAPVTHISSRDSALTLTSTALQQLDIDGRGEASIQHWMCQACHLDAPGLCDSAKLWEELLLNWEFDERAYCELPNDLQLLHDVII